MIFLGGRGGWPWFSLWLMFNNCRILFYLVRVLRRQTSLRLSPQPDLLPGVDALCAGGHGQAMGGDHKQRQGRGRTRQWWKARTTTTGGSMKRRDSIDKKKVFLSKQEIPDCEKIRTTRGLHDETVWYQTNDSLITFNSGSGLGTLKTHQKRG